MLKCPCSYFTISEIETKKEELISRDPTTKESICERCLNQKDTDCSNGLCLSCCKV